MKHEAIRAKHGCQNERRTARVQYGCQNERLASSVYENSPRPAQLETTPRDTPGFPALPMSAVCDCHISQHRLISPIIFARTANLKLLNMQISLCQLLSTIGFGVSIIGTVVINQLGDIELILCYSVF